MKKLNNKGFAISTMLYGLLIIILLVVAMILSTMAFSRKNNREYTEKIVDWLESYVVANSNIDKMYTYDASTCPTGTEPTCKQETITANKAIPVGTIINYNVDGTNTIPFNVIKDNGTTILMQSSQNIVDKTYWISAADYATENTDRTSCTQASCSDEGPMTALKALETATAGWSNVNSFYYSVGINQGSIWPGCSSYNTCNGTQTYKLEERTVKARMITVQEAYGLGCTGTNNSCPKWMGNTYWTMNAYTANSYGAWTISRFSSLSTAGTYLEDYGVRAVVEINKLAI